MDSNSVLKHDQTLLHVVDLMIETVMIAGVIVEAADDMKVVAVVEIDDLIEVEAVVNEVMIGGVAIETKNNRKHEI
jgi:hypothetical protein